MAGNLKLFNNKNEMQEQSTGEISLYYPKFQVSLLTVVSLTLEACKGIKLWWNGEITGKRCAEQIVNSLIVSIGAAGGAYLGCLGGSTIGSTIGSGLGTLFGGPVGTLIGGSIGSAVGGLLGSLKGSNKFIFI